MASRDQAPPLLELAELERRAISLCKEHVEATLTGAYHVEALEADLEWDPVALAHVYDQPMVIWRALSAFDVLLDDRDRPVGFVDEDKLLDCRWAEMPLAEAVELARATGFVPREMALVRSGRGEGDCLELTFGETTEAANGMRVRVNPARKAVISAVPLPEGLS